MRDNARHYYEFGSFRLDVKERELSKDGKVLALSPKAFDTLLILVERRGSLVEKDELMSLLWPDSFVEESSISQNVSVLRKTLGERSGDRQFIETIPKRGYRFVAAVTEVRGEPPMPSTVQEATRADEVSSQQTKTVVCEKRAPGSRHKMLFMPLSVLLVLLLAVFLYKQSRDGAEENIKGNGISSVAILPFKTLNPDPESQLFALGLTDALIIRLGKLNQPRILPTSAVIKYAGQERDAVDVGRELGVDAVLTGTVQQSGSNIRVTGQLMRTGDGKALWSGSFDGQLDSLFNLQDYISVQMTQALSSHINANQKEVMLAHLTENREANDAYLLGLFFWNNRSKENLIKAIEKLEQAIKLDPGFVRAYSLLADCYFLTASMNYEINPREVSCQLADYYAHKALELDDTVAEAHVTLAGCLNRSKKFDEAEAEYRYALQLAPNLSVIHERFGYFLFSRMRLDEALDEMRRAQELDPTSAIINGALSFILYMSRDYEAALSYAQRGYDLAPYEPQTMNSLGGLYILVGRYEEAAKIFRKLFPYDKDYAQLNFAYLYAVMGKRKLAEQTLSRLLQREHSILVYDLVVIYTALNRNELALKFLADGKFNPFEVAMLKLDPQLDRLRRDRRYDLVMSQLSSQANVLSK
jgi:DNA-binding winged helix-turn-helix (wHTH) protein/TolB-like protein/Flp pilus assembly protein TadD